MLEKPEIKVDFEKYYEWIKKGAKPTHTVKSIVKKVKSDN
jgi:ribosomal protein S16